MTRCGGALQDVIVRCCKAVAVDGVELLTVLVSLLQTWQMSP
jgi:hypothetical protein